MHQLLEPISLMSSRKRSRKSALIVHKTAAPSLRRSKSPVIQRKHIGFSLKRGGVQVSAGYVASSAKEEIPPERKKPEPTNWIDAETLLFCQEESLLMEEEEWTRKRTEDVGMSIPQQEVYLEELINHDGRGYNLPNECLDCSDKPGIYQCQCCFGQDLLCQDCTLRRHTALPFHRIRVGKI